MRAIDRRVERPAGRPRSFSDEDAFLALTRVILEHGVAGVSLAAVAREIGCTGQALNARFQSRLGLLIAYSDWTVERDLERFRDVRAAYPSPLAALRARFILPLEGREDELAAVGQQIRMLSLLTLAQHDPAFADRARKRMLVFEREVGSLIRDAIAASELQGADPADLAHQLLLLTVGGSVISLAATPAAQLAEIGTIVDDALAPFLIPAPMARATR